MVSKIRIEKHKDKKDVVWVGNRPIGELTPNPEFCLFDEFKFYSYVNVIQHTFEFRPLSSITAHVKNQLKRFFTDVFTDGSDIIE